MQNESPLTIITTLMAHIKVKIFLLLMGDRLQNFMKNKRIEKEIHGNQWQIISDKNFISSAKM